MSDAGIPLVMKVFTVRYRCPSSSVILIAVTLGKPDVGNAIAADAIKVVLIIKRDGCGVGKLSPTSLTNGTIIKAATVWDTKVATTKTKIPKIIIMAYKL